MNTQPQKTSTLATVALVLSILCAPIGLILGIIALVRISNSRGELGGKGVALAAIIVPVAMLPIAGILTAIAIPNFIRYQLRSKATEAQVSLQSIRVRQEQFFGERGFYVAFEPNPSDVLGPSPAAWEERACPAGCKDDPAACNEAACIDFKPGKDFTLFRYACTTKAPGEGSRGEVTCAAVGDLDGDGNPGAWIFRSGSGGAPVPEIAAAICTGSYPADAVSECKKGTF